MASDPTSTLNEVFILMGIGLLVILLRLYARWEAVGFSRWEADDYLMILAMVSILFQRHQNVAKREEAQFVLISYH